MPAATATPSAPTPARAVPTRRISFEELFADLPKHFAGDEDLIMSHVIACLSAVFPDGEDFFVASVRRYRDQVTDPELKRQVAGFIGQESVHGREHRALNDRLAALGYPTKGIERFTRKGLEIRQKLAPPTSNLAATAALEHYTATLAEVLLSDEEARRVVGDSPVLQVLLWHALEEAEHKAVAFDVYKLSGGSERMRTMTMNLITVGFIGGMTAQVVLSMLRDPATYEKGRLRASVRRLKTSPWLRKEVWQRLRDYNRADFHPDDHETDELLAEWREVLFGDEGRFNDLLAGAKAA